MIIERIPDLKVLSPADRFELAADLWESLEGVSGDLPVPEWHKAVLDKRFAEYGDSSEPGSPLDEVRERLMARIS